MPHILTTHVGSLPRSQPVVDQIFAREKGEPVDEATFDAVMAAANEGSGGFIVIGPTERVATPPQVRNSVAGTHRTASASGLTAARIVARLHTLATGQAAAPTPRVATRRQSTPPAVAFRSLPTHPLS